MQNSWRVLDSGESRRGLDDLVEYQRFLKRFKVVEEERRLKDILYDGMRFGALARDDEDC
ncbi:MAG: hypothetical protein KAT93_00235 [Desulfuromonadales bacterium]|nr:hypothetical protein [Desulfuromonadales bacterium]